ncbi:MAG: hypothetical protein QOE65_1741 [Solirubrobacteraceae bacterium]|nr:hypothetical protein [Solirubrobacteraceae bacterium]
MNAQPPGRTSQDSKDRGASRPAVTGAELLAVALALAAFAGAVLLVLSDFLTLFEVHTAAGVTVPGGSVKGHENHSYAMVLLGLAALPMAYGATRGGSRPAMAGLAVLGGIAIILALAFDLADATGTNTLARTFENAKGSPRAGFYTETLGAVLLLFSGVGGLILSAPGRTPNRRGRARSSEGRRRSE